jgi:hypothetical protein
MKQTITLAEPVQAHKALATLWREIKEDIAAGRRKLLTVKDETRRDGQNAHFHALIADISKHIGGELADEDDAKRILLSAFRIDSLNDPDFADEWRKLGDLRIGRGLRGETVLLGNQTRNLSVRLASGFIEWLNAFGIDHGVRFRAPKSWQGMEAC